MLPRQAPPVTGAPDTLVVVHRDPAATVGTFETRDEAEIAAVMLHSAGIRALVVADDEGGLNPGFFGEYGAIPGIEVCLASFDREIETLPGPYEPPDGLLLLATRGDDAAGCVGLVRIDETTCEMRRLYVRPAFRGLKAGRLLAEETIREAASLGYRRMRLETLPAHMKAAVALYESIGFRATSPGGVDGKPGAVLMERDLP